MSLGDGGLTRTAITFVTMGGLTMLLRCTSEECEQGKCKAKCNAGDVEHGIR